MLVLRNIAELDPYALRLRKIYDSLKLREHNASFSQQKESTANTLFVQDLDFRSSACFKHLQGLQETRMMKIEL